jgi:putative transposase
MLPSAARTGRPRTALRTVINAILYVLKTGCQWRALPKEFPPKSTVYGFFQKWRDTGVLSALHDRIRAFSREACGRRSRPTGAILDSQTVRSDGCAAEAGYDAGKKTKGRKRFILVDVEGHLLGIVVLPADVQERAGGKVLLDLALGSLEWLRKLWVDSGYGGEDFAEHARELRPNLEVEVVKRIEGSSGFHVLPRRWVVERTFAWLMKHRRLVRDYEHLPKSVEAWIHTAMIRIMLRRLA